MLLLHVGNHFFSFVPASIGFRCSFPSFHNSNIGIRKHRSIPLLILRIVLLRYDLSKDQTSIPWGNVSMENSSKFFPPILCILEVRRKTLAGIMFLRFLWSLRNVEGTWYSFRTKFTPRSILVVTTPSLFNDWLWLRWWEEVKIDDPWSLSQRTCCVWIIVYGINTMLITHGGIPRSRELLPRERLDELSMINSASRVKFVKFCLFEGMIFDIPSGVNGYLFIF